MKARKQVFDRSVKKTQIYPACLKKTQMARKFNDFGRSYRSEYSQIISELPQELQLGQIYFLLWRRKLPLAYFTRLILLGLTASGLRVLD